MSRPARSEAIHSFMRSDDNGRYDDGAFSGASLDRPGSAGRPCKPAQLHPEIVKAIALPDM